MDSYLTNVTYGTLCSILIFLFILFYKNERKKCEGFPFCHIFFKLAYDKIMGKVPKDVPYTSYLYDTTLEYCKKYSEEGLCMTYGFRPVLAVFGEKALKLFLNEKSAINKAPEYSFVSEVIGDGLLTNNGEKWKAHRKMINPVFHVGMLKDKVPIFNKNAAALVEDFRKLVGKPYVDVLDTLKSNYFNSLSEGIFGLKQDEENRTENLKSFALIDSLGELAVQRMTNPWLYLNCLLKYSSTGRRYLKQHEGWKNFIAKVINDMKDKVISSQTSDKDRFSNHLEKSFTYILLKHHLNNPSFTLQNVHDEISNILVAGYDSVSHTTLWCLFMLALHPEVQEMAFNEVECVGDGYITYEDAHNLTYLEAVILETLRLCPTVPVIARSLSEDVQFGKYKVHKGSTITFMFFMSHMNPEIFPNPEKFEPERFLNGETKKAASFSPFSEGSRSCIGKRYGLIEMKIFLAYILRNFTITSLDKKEDIRTSWNIILVPSKPIRMRITPRNAEERCSIEKD